MDSEVDVGSGPLDLPALAGDADRVTLGDGSAFCDRRLAEVGEGNGVSIRLDRHCPARGRNDADERDDSGRRSAHGLSGRSGDVDTPMLAGGIGIRAERVGTKHLSPQRP
jgi:hypothetical protein